MRGYKVSENWEMTGLTIKSLFGEEEVKPSKIKVVRFPRKKKKEMKKTIGSDAYKRLFKDYKWRETMDRKFNVHIEKMMPEMIKTYIMTQAMNEVMKNVKIDFNG